MPRTLSILMAQINPIVGAIQANKHQILEIMKQQQHDLVIFPELALTGYPPEDLLFRQELHDQINEALHDIQHNTTTCHVIVGHPSLENNRCYNSASLFANGQCIARYHKQHLPNYGVFDEQRYFTPGPPMPCLFNIKGYQLGLCICEDIWQTGPVEQLVHAGIDTLICINASPFDEQKPALRETLLRNHAKKGINIVYVNQVGGQDELVFDGQSLAMNQQGMLCAQAPAFVETLQTVLFQDKKITSNITPTLSREALLYQALCCGLHDYVEKNKFPGVVLGLSGGIDSALTLAIAVDALGADRVQAVMMPSRYTADISLHDAKQQANTMGVKYTLLDIEPTFTTLLHTLKPVFNQAKPDITEENLQARIRGILLMALSNKTGNMLLTTSNKSETAVGYCTLYGDMAGGFAVLKDVLKTTVYALARYRNEQHLVIPSRVLSRPPSAELANNQTDQDSLPDYAILDGILTGYMEQQLTASQLVEQGYPEHAVSRVLSLLQRNEYKRRQAPPGIKISTCAFDKDWRYPITSGFKEEVINTNSPNSRQVK